MALASDWLLDQHLALRGEVELELIPAPISPGDNFEYDGVVAQIEAVVHRCAIGMNGERMAGTHLVLSHGMRSDTDPNYRPDGAAIFAGLLEQDQRSQDPGISVEGERQSYSYGTTPTTESLSLGEEISK
jgi:hypothetical protein